MTSQLNPTIFLLPSLYSTSVIELFLSVPTPTLAHLHLHLSPLFPPSLLLHGAGDWKLNTLPLSHTQPKVLGSLVSLG